MSFEFFLPNVNWACPPEKSISSHNFSFFINSVKKNCEELNSEEPLEPIFKFWPDTEFFYLVYVLFYYFVSVEISYWVDDIYTQDFLNNYPKLIN